MKVVIPLAGPDYFQHGIAKGLTPTRDGPLLLATLKSRAWFKLIPSTNYSFVLLDSDSSRSFATTHLSTWFPGCSVTFLSHATRGAAFSVLAGIAAASTMPSDELIVDLADILFHTDYLPFDESCAENIAAVGYSFQSTLDCYSYYEVGSDGQTIISAAEKKVISTHASSGVYAFKTTSIYLDALSYALREPSLHTYNDLFYVCPLFNGVVKQGYKAVLRRVDHVYDVKSVLAPPC
jgi:hypothetical protein